MIPDTEIANLSASEMLDMIDTWFFCHASSDESAKLWNILSAIRGPDERNKYSKTDTTAIIRSRAFPKFAVVYPQLAQFEPSGRKIIEYPKEGDRYGLSTFSSHFIEHIKYADVALTAMKK